MASSIKRAPRAALAFLVLALAGVPHVHGEDATHPPGRIPLPPIFSMVQSGDIAGLKSTIAADKSQADLVGPAGMTPLGAALSQKKIDVVRALLEAGADPNRPINPANVHPIQAAALKGLTEAVDALLAHGADPNAKDANGVTALHEAALNGSVDIASKLAGKGASVDAVCTGGPNAGATPVHLAAKNKNMLMMIVLAAHHPKWGLPWNGRTAAQVADEAGASDVAAYIRERQAGKP